MEHSIQVGDTMHLGNFTFRVRGINESFHVDKGFMVALELESLAERRRDAPSEFEITLIQPALVRVLA